MRKSLIVAASVLALAACGKADETTTTEVDESVAEEKTENARLADAGEALEGAPAREDVFAVDEEAIEASAVEPESGAYVEPAYEEVKVSPERLTDIVSESDVVTVVDDAFSAADLNNDGELTKEEFAILTTSIADPLPELNVLEPVEGDVPADVIADAEATVMGVTSNAEALFEEAAGGADTLSIEDVRKAFLARFDAADVDDDRSLNPVERAEFIRLALGQAE